MLIILNRVKVLSRTMAVNVLVCRFGGWLTAPAFTRSDTCADESPLLWSIVTYPREFP
ncbi:MAG: hypothetical protein FWH14_05310 [Oscillospiraceae bacterium]|nr:hypothetical protein [Oscillospiraceae bacterium]